MNNLARPYERNRSWELFGDFDNAMGNWFRTPVVVRGDDNARAPAIDVSENESVYKVKAEIPGVPRENLDVTINDGVLTINAQRKEEKKDEKNGRVIRQERFYGKFVRSLRLGTDIDEAKVEAHYEDGVLNLTLPKTAEVKPRKVDIKIR
ncbi:MAG: heat-shock protein Hsp20 [Acidiferrobacteraceae bacterium]|jgi:HSP20 family protein|nr:heat-shock protein Hsp20 [Acidiferrobacteraceae bacterium]MCP4830334.1 Hsp20/alpha crystallin family protein [Pseudomonadota bacterium]HJP08064.1 Hsp20/alpha crystallin family protein [Arenicellales bacterium]|tara:strand:- start:14361 stop:14810 length:450 start_codon:yes stop_codon:yes gene_type:complete